MISSMQNVNNTPTSAGVDSGATAIEHPALMPMPNLAAADPMTAMYAIMAKQRTNDLNQGKANIAHNREAQQADLLEQQADFKKQEDAEQNAKAWGIFGKIASVIAIAVSAVASACSCGAASALCAAACVLSTMAFAEGEAHVLTTITGNPDVDKAFQIGCGIGAALCSGGAGIATLGSSALVGTSEILSSSCKIGQEAFSASSDKGCQDASLALGIGGAVSGVVGSFGGIGDAGSTVGAAVGGTVQAVNGAVQIGAGVTTIASSAYEADATDRAADAKQAGLSMDRQEQVAQWVIDGMKDADESHAHALQTLSGAMQTQAQTLVMASSKV
jgi:hypothetical protein